MTAPPARRVCPGCRRPEVVCWCAHVPELPTRTRVLILQHPRERRVAIGTARMAHRALPGSTLRVGVSFERDPVVAAALADERAHLLFPGEEATDVRALAAGPPITLVVLDGTWPQAKKLLKLNPQLAALPRVAFRPSRPSEYRIRREPDELYVSTIEALAEVLRILEGEREDARFARLLEPFRAMVDRQLWFATEVHTGRKKRPRPARPSPRALLEERLRAEWPRLVCLHGEANAWPAARPSGERPPPEMVAFVAHRPSEDALFTQAIAPRGALSPTATQYLELDEALLRAGGTVEDWRAAWQAFARPDDVLVTWGRFHTDLAVAEGLTLPERRLDLRKELAERLALRALSLEDCLARLSLVPAPLVFPRPTGRAGRRLSAVLALLHHLCPPPQ